MSRKPIRLVCLSFLVACLAAFTSSLQAQTFYGSIAVVITGTSAGGWMAFLLAAETFPLAGVAPDVAPMNWGYNGAHLLKQKDRLTPKAPALYGKLPAERQALPPKIVKQLTQGK